MKFDSRGEGWVIAQFTLLPLLFILTFALPRGPLWPPFLAWGARVAGLALAAGSSGLFVGGVIALGRNLTPFPKPIDDGYLVRSGVYTLVRHPIYSGITLGMFALGLFLNSLPGLTAALVAFLFFDAKARHEERWLRAHYPDYADYSRRTRKLIPFIY
jgi:protein-S-isoprenylcysteine O-methyltransferase Ste14